MESKTTSQALAVKQGNKQPRWLPLNNAAPRDGEDEGGLNLSQVAAVLRRRIPIVLGVTTVVSSAALLKAVTSEPIYQSTFEILTKPVTAESQVISSVPQTLSNREQQQPAPEKTLDETKLKLLKSPTLLEPIAQKLKPKYPDLTYDVLSNSLVVAQVPNSEVLRVSFQDSNRTKVREVLTLVSQAYLNYSLEERLAAARQGMKFVDQQIPRLQQRVETVQDQLQTFRQRYNLIDPDLTSKQLAEQTATIAQQRLETDVKLDEALALNRDLRQQLTQKNEPASSALRENTRYQNLLNQLLEVEAQMAKTSSVFQEKAPQIQLLRSQLENLQPLLEREGGRSQGDVESQVRGLKARQAILIQTEELLKQQVKQLSARSRQYTDIQQELKIGTDNLNQFLTKREALRIDAGQQTAPWQILTPTTNPKLASAGIKQTGALGVLLGLLMGVGTALLLEKLSNVLHTPEEVKDTANLPMLGVIPFNAELAETEKRSLALDVPRQEFTNLMRQMRQKLNAPKSESSYLYDSSPFSEAFRSLYTNIRLLNPDTRIRSLAISSPSPGEGKSTVALYLAQAAAALGQRVLLVDTDLRCPQLHVRLQLPNLHGLSDVVSSEVKCEHAVQQSPGEPNLFILTVGQVPPDPTRLLSSKKMQTLMQQFEEMYDLVIYDVPPLLGLADAKLVATNTNGIVLVVGLDKTKSAALRQALEGFKVSSVFTLGVVANDMKNS
ncbi:MAG: polysaccharide biosynthesis tyrosine autokinase [Myxacorys californica WJT36-NPBG1]|jgi:capsular exopolysaccharide synthesis family protein|nr:polysaccharide biosynthesis tyrosine autokinase [Myxacorys californica WJT36-NPBG1]